MSEQEKANLATVYQATMQLLTAEQQGIWSRMVGFFTLNLIAGGAIGLHIVSPVCTRIFSVIGITMLIALFSCLLHSFRLRDSYVETMRKQEKQLGLVVVSLGPLTVGNKYRKGLNQKIFSIFVGISLAIVYLFVFLHGTCFCL